MSEAIKIKINALAEELVTLNRTTQNAEVKKIQLDINSLFLTAEMTYKHIDVNGNDWYTYALLDNLVAPFDTVDKTLNENMKINRA